MKTVFKKGMKVYDQIYEPDVKGEVLDVNLDISPHPITVKFGSCVRYYTAEGCRGKNQIRTLSTSPYRIEGFEQKAPAPTYEEAVNWIENNKRYNPAYVEIDEKEKVFLSKTYFYAFEALRKLIILRDYYNEGWQPNWKKEREIKYVIYNDSNKLATIQSYTFSYVLAFKEGNIRNKFLEEQKELLEIAKPLL